MSAGPLAGRRVVITRAAHQAGELASLLRDVGAEPIVAPLIDIAAPADDGVALDAALRVLDRYDWLVVTSPNGARRVAESLQRGGVDLVGARAQGTRIAAVGTATGDALGAAPDLLPARQLAEGLVEVFPDGTGRVLVAQAADALPTLREGLAAKGWHVDVVDAYRTVSVRPSAGELLAILSADAVLFASGSAVRAWVQSFGTTTPPVVVAIGPATAAIADEIGLKVDAVAADHSLGGMVTSLLTHLADSH